MHLVSGQDAMQWGTQTLCTPSFDFFLNSIFHFSKGKELSLFYYLTTRLLWEDIDSCLSQMHFFEPKHEQPRLELEHSSLSLFSSTITIKPTVRSRNYFKPAVTDDVRFADESLTSENIFVLIYNVESIKTMAIPSFK